jgi:hypothetical protein
LQGNMSSAAIESLPSPISHVYCVQAICAVLQRGAGPVQERRLQVKRWILRAEYVQEQARKSCVVGVDEGTVLACSC